MVMFGAVPLFLPLMRRIRLEPVAAATERSSAQAAEDGAL
jgi:hypothetical protein